MKKKFTKEVAEQLVKDWFDKHGYSFKEIDYSIQWTLGENTFLYNVESNTNIKIKGNVFYDVTVKGNIAGIKGKFIFRVIPKEAHLIGRKNSRYYRPKINIGLPLSRER